MSIGSTASAGSYTTKCSDGDPGSNYTISGYTPGTLTIARANSCLSLANATGTYSGNVSRTATLSPAPQGSTIVFSQKNGTTYDALCDSDSVTAKPACPITGVDGKARSRA